ncbi:ankyrin repeat-containing domain protein [Macrophomina phaseolina]|uniref:Ankyrin repeat-containing domain protein n=1 Tax=Macrophomina phaseolina TaxID=35725 RepID=A0ABQ8G2Q1_9PEZI|nr:ankyrin repeat-containing domain protein [Macrophomina phaseolina]
MDERRRAQNRDAQRRHRISTRARLAELEALKARLSTLPVSPVSIAATAAAATAAPARDHAAALSPKETEPWTDFLNWTEPPSAPAAALGAGTIPQQPAVREQPFPAPLDDPSGWAFPPVSTPTAARCPDPEPGSTASGAHAIPDHATTPQLRLDRDPSAAFPACESSCTCTQHTSTPRLRHGPCAMAMAAASPSQHHQGPHRGPRCSSRSPLHLAAMEGNAACVRALLRHKADVNGVDVRGATPLHACAEHGNSHGHAAVVRILIEHGADMDARDDDGATPLQAAAANSNDKVLDALATLGADVNAA